MAAAACHGVDELYSPRRTVLDAMLVGAARVAGAEPVMTHESGQMNVPLDTADRAADVLIGFRQAGVAIASVSVAKPTLDEVFLAITGHGTGQDDDPGAAEPAAAADIPLEVTK